MSASIFAKGAKDFATDDGLRLSATPVKKPGVKMPTWDSVIAEADYPPLAAYAELGSHIQPATPSARGVDEPPAGHGRGVWDSRGRPVRLKATTESWARIPGIVRADTAPALKLGNNVP